MKQFRFLVAGVFLLVICGCNAVVSKRPVGETPAKIVAKDGKEIGSPVMAQ